jgi:isoleucyl-tRNA synthetase
LFSTWLVSNLAGFPHVSPRRFGWDCHGLPVEYEIDQKLGIVSPDQVIEMGIATYNGHCRSIVSRYCEQWEEIVTRLGRWIDFKNDYKVCVSFPPKRLAKKRRIHVWWREFSLCL